MGDFERMTVLLVEPHQLVRRILRDILRGLGVGSSVAVDTIEDAYRHLADAPVDLIFTDWSSATDAIALLRLVRAEDSPNPFVPVVVMSAYGDRDHVRAARDLGINEYMLKPFAPQTVASHLRAVARQPRMFVRSGNFFGPDRRRHRGQEFPGPERRRQSHYVERRHQAGPYAGPERRHQPPDKGGKG